MSQTFAQSSERVLVIEDHPLTRELIATALRSWGYIVESAESANQAWRIAERFSAHVVIADLDLRVGPSGMDAVQVLRKNDPSLPVVYLTDHRDPHLVDERPLGIRRSDAYLVKGDLESLTQLRQAVEDALKHRTAKVQSPADVPAITKGQAEVLKLIAEGLSNEEIAARRFTSRRAVELSIQRLYRALGLTDSASNNRVVAVNMFRRSEVTVR